MRVLLVAVAALVSPLIGVHSAQAQHASSATGAFEVEVTDSASGRPVPRVSLATDVPSPRGLLYGQVLYGSADTAGRVRLERVPAGRPLRFVLSCTTWVEPLPLDGSVPGSLALDSTTAVLQRGEIRRWVVRLATPTVCDRRPFAVRSVALAGQWVAGPDDSGFTPCDSRQAPMWAVVTDSVPLPAGARWPKTLGRRRHTYFVRWEGVLVGPWRYGHLGVYTHQLYVQRILELRPWTGRWCAQVSARGLIKACC